MPIRFSTQAANADKMDDDAPKAPRAVGSGSSRERSDYRRGPADDAADAGKPGKDINAPGFIKDKDAPKP